MEIWKDILDYEGYYQISDQGRVKSLKRNVKHKYGYRVVEERILKNLSDGIGYNVVSLNKEGILSKFRIHILMAVAFLNHNPKGYKLVVDHKNNIKIDNRLENLQIITQRKNTSKDKKNKTSKYIGVCFDKARNKFRSSIRIKGEKKHLGLFDDEYEAHLAYQKELNTL